MPYMVLQRSYTVVLTLNPVPVMMSANESNR